MIVIVECGTKGARPLTIHPKGCNSLLPYAGVAQLARALPCQGRGREFESLHPLHFLPLQTWPLFGFANLSLPRFARRAKPRFARRAKALSPSLQSPFVLLPLQTWLRQDLQDGQRWGFRPLCNPPSVSWLCKLGLFLPLQTWLRQDLQDGRRWGFRPLCNPPLQSLSFCCLLEFSIVVSVLPDSPLGG